MSDELDLLKACIASGHRNGACGLTLDAFQRLARLDDAGQIAGRRAALAEVLGDDGQLTDELVKLVRIGERHARYRALPKIEDRIDQLIQSLATEPTADSPQATMPDPDEPAAEPVPGVRKRF